MKLSNSASRWFGGLFAAALSLLSIGNASAQILWYNGDRNFVNSLNSTDNGTGNSAIVYDDFTVTSSTGWQVTGVFGTFKLPNTVTNANWEIRSGVSAGNGGTLLDSGENAPVVLTPGASSGGFTQYTVAVTGLNFDLAPGTYWLGLQPISTGAGFLVTTSGANAVGTPAGNDSNAFWTSSTLGIPNNGESFESTTSSGDPNLNSNLIAFSLGVDGTVVPVPEPSSWALVLVCMGLLASLRARSKRA